MRTSAYRAVVMLVLSVLAVTSWGVRQAIAHTPIGGSASATDVTITDHVLWTTLRSVTVNFTGDGHNHNCAVTASADVGNPGGVAENGYVFAVALDTTAPAENDTSARKIWMRDNANVNDPDSIAIATTKTFTTISPAVHTIRFLGKKYSGTPAALDATVEDSSMSIVCAENLGF